MNGHDLEPRLTRRQFIMKTILTLTVSLSLAASVFAAEGPNILLITADDYGIPGVGCGDGAYKTPIPTYRLRTPREESRP